MIILDTSGLLTAIDDSQTSHETARAALAASQSRILSPFVLAELDYLISTRIGRRMELALLGEVERGAYHLASFTSEDVRVARGILDHYGDLSLGLADASIIVLAERYRSHDILTLDERHFRAVTALDGQPFRLLPPDLAS